MSKLTKSAVLFIVGGVTALTVANSLSEAEMETHVRVPDPGPLAAQQERIAAEAAWLNALSEKTAEAVDRAKADADRAKAAADRAEAAAKDNQ